MSEIHDNFTNVWVTYLIWSYLNEYHPMIAHYYMRHALNGLSMLEKSWIMLFMSDDEYHVVKLQGFCDDCRPNNA